MQTACLHQRIVAGKRQTPRRALVHTHARFMHAARSSPCQSARAPRGRKCKSLLRLRFFLPPSSPSTSTSATMARRAQLLHRVLCQVQTMVMLRNSVAKQTCERLEFSAFTCVQRLPLQQSPRPRSRQLSRSRRSRHFTSASERTSKPAER